MTSIFNLKKTKTKNKSLSSKRDLFGINPRERAALLWVIVIISAITLVVAIDNSRSREVVITCCSEKPATANTASPVKSNIKPPVISSDKAYWQSFGDLFSSDVYLDAEKTDMTLDENMTALVFPPVYEFSRQQSCSDSSCGLSFNDIQQVYDNEELPNFKDLSRFPKPLPVGIGADNIVFANISEFADKKIALFVVSEGGEERGLAYFISGSKYLPLITLDTEQQIITKYGRGGGRMAASGDNDNFLIVYLGYEGRAFHYHDEKLEDISRFFGIRVSDLGFYPQIIQQGKGKNSIWYILSLNSEKNKLIKLWQNQSNQIVGAYDFSNIISQRLSENNGKLLAIASGKNRGELKFVVDEGLNIFENYTLWTFQDNGFDNSRSRFAVSKNINNQQLPVAKALIKDIRVALGSEDGVYQNQFPCPELKIFLSNDADNFLAVTPGKIINFPELSPGLYWQVEFLSSNEKEYSPWFDNLNDLQYLIAS